MNKHGWTNKKLGEVATMYQPKTLSTAQLIDDGEYLVYGANGIIGRYTEYNHENSEILMTCRGATCGVINVSEPKSWINGNAMVIHPNSDDYLQKYWVYALISSDKSKIITGLAQPQITRQNLKELVIPIPPMDEQEAIVAELDEINEVIACLHQQVADLDALEQSTFYTMFGDPVTNEKGWEVKKFADCIKLSSGQALSAKNFVHGDFPVYGGNGLAGYHNVFNLSGNNIIIGRVGAQCGNVRNVKGNIFVTDNAFIVSKRIEADNIYLTRLLVIHNLRHYAREAMQPVISNTTLKNVPIILPPLALQQEFVAKIEAIEAAKAEVNAQIAEMQTLLDSRMDYYFN